MFLQEDGRLVARFTAWARFCPISDPAYCPARLSVAELRPSDEPAGVRTYFGPVSPAVRVALNHPEAAVEASDVLGQPSHISGRLRGCGGRGLEPVQQV